MSENKAYKPDQWGRDEFLLSQIQPLGLEHPEVDENHMMVYNPEAEHPMPSWGRTKIFTIDNDGNMVINYWTVEGEMIIYYNDKLKNPKPIVYETKRWREPKGDRKYDIPSKEKGSPGAIPWFHPITVKAFQDGEKIKTLYLTEGVKKAFMAGLHGVHVVGLSSITCYADKDRQLHRGIRQVIETCGVENLVVLWDGDCLDISTKAIRLREESTKRVFNFFNSAKRIRALAINAMPEERTLRIYFMHIKSKAWKTEEPKGLDDLLTLATSAEKLQPVLKDMQNVEESGPFFYRAEITKTTAMLYKYFKLDDVTHFYYRHAAIIENTEFVFKGDIYKYDEGNEAVKLIQPGWAERIFFVGNDYFEEVLVPSARKEFYTKRLEPRKAGTLSARFPKGWQRYLSYYQSFVCIPNHLSGYQRIIEVGDNLFINKYHPFPHIPKQGKWDNIKKFLQHIFGKHKAVHPKTEEKILGWEMGLDYMQQLLMNPLQPLPVLMLYSPENQTGKSTFTELCYRIFGLYSISTGNGCSGFMSNCCM
ncbi:MAG: hypothetical protein AAFO02_01475 [Bacteroidota bacterium]